MISVEAEKVGDGPAAVVPAPPIKGKGLNEKSHCPWAYSGSGWEGELRLGESENLPGYSSPKVFEDGTVGWIRVESPAFKKKPGDFLLRAVEDFMIQSPSPDWIIKKFASVISASLW